MAIPEAEGGSEKIISYEAIRDLIEQAVLSPSERKRLKKEFELSQEGGSGTIWLKSWEEFQDISERFEGQLRSPGGAASRIRMSRARIHQLEAEGKIRAYRLRAEEITDEEFKGI